MQPRVSIIITTRNRAEHLRATLASFRALLIPPELHAELLVVDNASTDGTADVINSTRLPQMPVRYLHEPRQGQSNARNSGIANTSGELILFTDDDVRVPENWIVGMTEAMLSGQAEAVSGAVRLAPHIERPWMTGCHKSWLANSNPNWVPGQKTMTGANMGFSRAVLKRVPAFDPELGPGALGFSDDTLFSLQLVEAGFRIQSMAAIEIEHQPEKDRLLRRHWLLAASRRGATKAYVTYHWLHDQVRRPRLKRLRAVFRLWVWRTRNRAPDLDQEGCAEPELWLVRSCCFWRGISRELRVPRNYSKRGLVKLRGVRLAERQVPLPELTPSTAGG
jgi:glucosyl-dolichyl phosphate glucuronosyltransferase